MRDKSVELVAKSMREHFVPKFAREYANEVVSIVRDNDTRHITLESIIEILEAEPDNPPSSTSLRQGYVRCVRDKIGLIRQKFG